MSVTGDRGLRLQDSANWQAVLEHRREMAQARSQAFDRAALAAHRNFCIHSVAANFDQGRISLMHVTKDGEALPDGEPWTAKLRLRSKPNKPVMGVALDGPGATRAYKWSLWKTYGIIYGAITLGLLLSLPKVKTPGAAVGFLLVVAAFYGMIVFFHLRELRRWKEKVDQRVAGLPAAGTTVLASPQSLDIAGHVYPWHVLNADYIDLIKKTGKRKSWTEVDRIRLVTPEGHSLTLDSVGYRNGEKLVDAAVSNLWPRLTGNTLP
jgi:hypothetical protein